MNINNCKQCGSKPFDIEFGTVFDYNDKNYQIGNIGCGNNKCLMDIMITFEVDKVSHKTVTEAATAAWNLINYSQD